MDYLDRDVKRALELGYGVHYGRYKVDYPNTRDMYDKESEQTVETRTCKECGGEFVITRKNQKYCCNDCYRRYNDRARRNRKVLVPNGTCYSCGIELPEGSRRRTFCSDACVKKYDKAKKRS